MCTLTLSSWWQECSSCWRKYVGVSTMRRDTAGLRGKGAPYRLDAGQEIKQLSDEEKMNVSGDVIFFGFFASTVVFVCCCFLLFLCVWLGNYYVVAQSCDQANMWLLILCMWIGNYYVAALAIIMLLLSLVYVIR